MYMYIYLFFNHPPSNYRAGLIPSSARLRGTSHPSTYLFISLSLSITLSLSLSLSLCTASKSLSLSLSSSPFHLQIIYPSIPLRCWGTLNILKLQLLNVFMLSLIIAWTILSIILTGSS